MKKIIVIYFLLVLSVIVQVTVGSRSPWAPDIILLMVVFEGIFRSGAEAIIFAFIAGFIRGSLSFGTIQVDVFIFPIIGAIGFLEGRIFYRHNPIAQALITAIAISVVMAAHMFCLKNMGGDSAGMFTVSVYDWKTLLGTVISAPVFFFLLSKLLQMEE